VTVTTREPRTDRRHQEALYAAQHWAGLHDTSRRNYRDIRDLEARLTEIMGTEWWADHYPDVPRPRLARLDKRSKWGGVATSEGIWIRTLDDATLLHELAHWVCDDHGHGPAYAERFLQLLREFAGFYAYAALRNGLQECRYWEI
jgi:hypothetical protein